MSGSGYRQPPALARRSDGQTIQLTPMLYLLLEALDGRRDHDELAAVVSSGTGRNVSASNVATLVDKLRDMGLATTADGKQPEVQRSNPLLALRFKAVVTDPERTRRLTTPFAALFNPVLVAVVVAAFAWICWWVLFERGLASATHDAFARPGLLLAVLAITVLSAGFHEFGHAAAARRGGAPPGAMGVGLYLIWPAFYTDVTDSYRLGRAGGCAPISAASTSTRSSPSARSRSGGPRGTTRSCCWSPRRSCRCCASCCRWSGSTATTCSRT